MTTPTPPAADATAPVPVLVPMSADQSEELMIALEWVWRMELPARATAEERAMVEARRARVAALYARVGPILVQHRGWDPREWRIDGDRHRVGATLTVKTDPAPRPVEIPTGDARVSRRGSRVPVPMTEQEARDLLRGLQFRAKQHGIAPTRGQFWNQQWQEIVEFGAYVAEACEDAFGWPRDTWATLLADAITTRIRVAREQPRPVVR